MFDSNPQCSKFVPLLDAFHDDELPMDEKMSVSKHLRMCEGCRAHLQDIKSLVMSLHSLPRLKMPHQLQLDWSTLAHKENTDSAQRESTTQTQPPINEPGKVVYIQLGHVLSFPNHRQWAAAAALALVLFIGAGLLLKEHLSPLTTAAVDKHALSPLSSLPKGDAPFTAASEISAAKAVASSSRGALNSQSADRLNDRSLEGGASQMAKESGNGDLIALYPNDSNLISEELGIATDEDGLYALKL